MTVDRRQFMTGLVSLSAGVALSTAALAQEMTVRGITVRLHDRDKAWLKRHCERRGFSEGTAEYKECFDAKAREILEQRARDAVYRPSGP